MEPILSTETDLKIFENVYPNYNHRENEHLWKCDTFVLFCKTGDINNNNQSDIVLKELVQVLLSGDVVGAKSVFD